MQQPFSNKQNGNPGNKSHTVDQMFVIGKWDTSRDGQTYMIPHIHIAVLVPQQVLQVQLKNKKISGLRWISCCTPYTLIESLNG